MSTNEERREAARRKLEDRLEHERRAARQRTLSVIAVAGVFVLALAAVGGFFWYRSWDNSRHTECTYEDAPVDFAKTIQQIQEQLKAAPAEQKAAGEALLKSLQEGAPKQRSSPKPESRTLNTGTVNFDLATNKGDVPIELDRSKAACNVNAIAALANNDYYNDTSCHRLSQSKTLSILQCGDPTHTGMGGPGWHSPDENPTGLKEVPMDPRMAQLGMNEQAVVYPRGTVAIANSNDAQQGRANTGSAQFFIVTKDTQLTPTLAVVGKVSEKGMKVVDEVAEGGIAPAPGSSPEDGYPKIPLEIKKATAEDAA
ncbi:peptidylprolyl isomerase [Gordonia zhaorongruii]|uniref:peptidylprolyl isomerase n=1 Tax=Gordonia zhaorongruii TaxID=2597659 RepID=UPI00104C8E25|nr:peptidylprolyl isomerase [Gordonia zhaorongruii]